MFSNADGDHWVQEVCSFSLRIEKRITCRREDEDNRNSKIRMISTNELDKAHFKLILNQSGFHGRPI